MIKGWLSEQHQLWISNPNAIRDYRTQMRSGRAPMYWGAYSGLLIAVTLLAYSTIGSLTTSSIISFQQQMSALYSTVSTLLGFIIVIASPLIISSLIRAEFDRRSIDLIASSPMTPQNFLVGKLLSGWRMVWMMTALSLPIVAACVVNGGARWDEVVGGYWLHIMRGLMYGALAIPISLWAKKTVTSSLILIGLIIFLQMTFAAFSAASAVTVSMGGPAAEPSLLMFPFSYNDPNAVTSMTTLGVPIPYLLSCTLLALAVTGVFVLGGAAMMSRMGSRHSIVLRSLVLIICPLLCGLDAANRPPMGGPAFAGSPMAAMPLLLSALAIPCLMHIAVYDLSGDRKRLPEGPWKWRSLLAGGAGSALPFALVFPAVMLTGAFVGRALGTPSRPPESYEWAGAAWLIGIWAVCTCIFRLTSGLGGVTGERAAAMGTAIITALIFLPLPVMIAAGTASETSPILMLWAPMALVSDEISIVLGCTIVVWVGAIGTFIASELVRSSKEKQLAAWINPPPLPKN